MNLLSNILQPSLLKCRVVAEYLSDLAIVFGEEEDFLFLDKRVIEIKEDVWNMYFDGAVNQKGYRLGIILIASKGTHTPLAIKLKYTSTNNAAKYEA